MDRERRAATRLAAVLVAAGLSACLYDADDVCSRNQELDGGVCECVAGAVPAEDGDGCTPCGAHEVVAGAACVCAEGYTRASEEAPCEPVPAGLNAACDPGGVACADEQFAYCRATGDAAGYCTSSGCETSADCPDGYACAEDGEIRYCKRPPTGQGAPCESSADCAGYEAAYCETFVEHACFVSGCTSSPDSCHEGWECCDLSTYIPDLTLCVEEGACPTAG
jgi:hypothetical protein